MPETALAPRSPPLQPPAMTTGREAIEPPLSDALSADGRGDCVVFGQVVDEFNQPLAGVAIRLQGFYGWAEGIDVPRIPGDEFPGWEVAINEEGRFRFQVPMPTVHQTRIKVEPDPFHDLVEVHFGGDFPGALPALGVGEHDLGVLRATSAGGVRGKVFDESNRGIAGVELSISSGRDSTKWTRWGVTDASGAYTIGHVPAGFHNFEVKCDGYTLGSPRNIEVTVGRFTEGIDFVLKDAPLLRGVVVDETGAPLEGVDLWGWPKDGGSGAGARSERDGSFEVSLPQNDPYSLEAKLAGYAPYDSTEQGVIYPPGTRGLRIELKRETIWPVLVVDSDTNQPVELFGLDVRLNNSAHAPHRVYSSSIDPQICTHPGGTANVAMRLGVDVLLVLVEGRKEVRIDPDRDQLEDGRIVVRIAAGSTVRGRLLRGTEPVSGFSVRLCSGWWRSEHEVNAEINSKGVFRISKTDVRNEQTDANGCFRLEDLDRGDYLLIAPEKGGMAINVAPFIVDKPELDLGDLQLVAGASIVGQVIVPAGRSRAGLSIHLDERDGEQERITKADGRFRFDGLRGGNHKIVLDEVEGVIVHPPSLELSLTSGEQRDVVLDASQCGTCQVRLTILLGTKPAADRVVELVNLSAASTTRDSHRVTGREESTQFLLGRTDANGYVAGWAPAWGSTSVVLHAADSADDFGLEHPTAKFDLELDVNVEQTVAFDCGTLVIRLPDGLVLPNKGCVLVTLRAGAMGRKTQEFYTAIAPEQDSRDLTFNDVLGGEAELEFKLIDLSVKPGLEKNVDGSTNLAPTLAYKTSQPVTIRSGQTTRVQLR